MSAETSQILQSVMSEDSALPRDDEIDPRAFREVPMAINAMIPWLSSSTPCETD